MTIQACLRKAAGTSLLVMASGALTLGGADPQAVSSSPVEQAAPSPRDDAGPVDPTPDLSLQPAANGSGSGGAEAQSDPWADAFAESVAAQVVTPTPAEPAYPVVVNAQVQYFIDRYTGSRREVIELWLSRSGRYLEMIHEVFRAHGIPEDLAFVAMIESGFNPRAVSRVGAKGMWQFMAPTARRYGLRVDQWVDERLDPEKSTVAAAAYLRDLYRQFGSWPLAKAAYNAGEVKVIRAIHATGSTDFWTLSQSRFLRRETKDFVPAIHAATLIGRDPARYGFDPTEPEETAAETVTVPASTNLKMLALASGVPLSTVRAFNPVLVKNMTPPKIVWELKVPAENSERVRAALAAGLPTVHVVQARETIGGIANRYGVTVAELARWNGLERPDRIRPGTELRVTPVRLSAERAVSRAR